MELIKWINIGLRFLIEIAALICLGYWGFHAANRTIIKIVLGIGAPLITAIIWGTFGSPKAAYPLQGFSMLVLEVAVFGSAAVALYASGKQRLAILYAIVTFINLVLMKIWRQ
ncbi:YrdB family protein [Neobacillus endophyticus]|uniref:YrdB family protein n=1 Tax=Neobacillus endophyticus TaxID=2738405 RepID=UPI0028AD43BC|nr:YrdB family protein [Neobacillus endophyticus]